MVKKMVKTVKLFVRIQWILIIVIFFNAKKKERKK